MPIVKVGIKWNGKKYENIELDTDHPGLIFKTQVYTLTGVPPERQKIMVKGVLKDDADMNKLGIKEGQTFMMMGTAGELPKAPEKPTMFMEDMTDAQLAQALKLPSGLTNLGNTCYMNATLQCLRAIPELHKALDNVSNSLGNDSRSNLAISLRGLFQELEKSGEPVPPLVFLQILRLAFPQFGESDRRGFMQQDAEECWGQIVSALREAVPGLDAEEADGASSSVSGAGEAAEKKNIAAAKFVDQFMTGEIISTMQCKEAPEEPATTTVETFSKLTVNIGSGVSTYMVADIMAGLTQPIEKNSPSLNRSAEYTKTSRVSRLPHYLTVNFVRFQWKPEQQVKAKILKKVKFPLELDAVQFCTPELQEKLLPARNKFKEIEDAKAAAKKLKRKQPDSEKKDETTIMEVDASTPAASTSEEAKPMEDVTATEKGKGKRPLKEVYKELGVDEGLAADVGANVSGLYDLVAVLTHVGRAADSGHYIAWVKNPESEDEWWKYDDDKVSPVKTEEISKLEGGGDWHTAYILLYKSKTL
ncbi:Ubiquitin carboxyl-terminal hydrolase 14 [Quaeritorhiza haematococci]|nr:Ubiquitin carboxyl-terminal hydrolase 14 [Quaeritorhiza haematococci]